MRIPLVDLTWQQREIADEVREGFDRLMESGQFVLGEEVEEFEAEYADFCGVEHCVGVANGTDALELGLRALDIGQGDEVILPANTFVASALAVVRSGATPVLVDCAPSGSGMDTREVADRMGARTRAVMAVDLFGELANQNEIEALAEESGIALVEDAAQAQGARREGRAAGAFGALAGTSFYPGKNLGAYGDAGAVTTRSPELAGRLRRLRNYGSERKYEHPEIGFNSRLDALQAVVLRAKLRRLDSWNDARRRAARYYDEALGDVAGVELPPGGRDASHVWHIYAVRVSSRDRVLEELQAAGVGVGIHYPTPIHLLGGFAFLGHRGGEFPRAESAAAAMISLPLFPGIREAQQERVVELLAAAVAGKGS
ncbi:MAG: DegT/DnrJ/EryC1/StrS family aminotransferase [Myxococcota bacterium]|jgi:dTDP-4-amino-4,6-dideoxygalactose transaminase|nr:DegT/DnrJ/EryC1/StrS family aminotransferase [Myxococcota bacterium]